VTDQPRVPAGSPHGGEWASTKSGSTSGPTSSRGNWQEDPLSGEKPGQHTPAAQRRLMDYLEKETGEKFAPHGSVGKGKTSLNDFDIIVKEPNEDDAEAAWIAGMKEQDAITAKADRGEITRDQAMEEIFGAPTDRMTPALEKIGFKLTREMGFSGTVVYRYKREKTGHTLELWTRGDQGSPESGPAAMWSRDYDPKTGKEISHERDIWRTSS